MFNCCDIPMHCIVLITLGSEQIKRIRLLEMNFSSRFNTTCWCRWSSSRSFEGRGWRSWRSSSRSTGEATGPGRTGWSSGTRRLSSRRFGRGGRTRATSRSSSSGGSRSGRYSSFRSSTGYGRSAFAPNLPQLQVNFILYSACKSQFDELSVFRINLHEISILMNHGTQSSRIRIVYRI